MSLSADLIPLLLIETVVLDVKTSGNALLSTFAAKIAERESEATADSSESQYE